MKKIKNVLIVDDDAVSSYLIHLTIEEIDIALHIASVKNGKQALDFLEENCLHPMDKVEQFWPAFILLDLNMPVMDGFEFLEEFGRRFAAYTDKISICILSSSSAGKDKLKALNYPISGFITKPLTEEKLKPILEMI
jgi:CheY-like chemotaxis protein